MSCPEHPNASVVVHPARPRERRCAHCSQLLMGPASAPRYLSSSSSCLMLLAQFLLFVGAIAAAIVLVNQ